MRPDELGAPAHALAVTAVVFVAGIAGYAVEHTALVYPATPIQVLECYVPDAITTGVALALVAQKRRGPHAAAIAAAFGLAVQFAAWSMARYRDLPLDLFRERFVSELHRVFGGVRGALWFSADALAFHLASRRRGMWSEGLAYSIPVTAASAARWYGCSTGPEMVALVSGTLLGGLIQAVGIPVGERALVRALRAAGITEEKESAPG